MTKTHLSDQFVLAVKDQLRNVRYQIRRSAEGGGARAHRFAPHVPRPVALAAASVFSQVEAAATAFLPENEHQSGALAFPQPVSAYFGPEAEEANALAPEIYYVLKGLLRRFGLEVFLVSEQAVDEALDALKAHSGAMVDVVLDGSRPSSERMDATVRLCAALSAELAAARPIREMMTSVSREPAPRNLARAPNDYCALMVGLAVALASKSELERLRPRHLDRLGGPRGRCAVHRTVGCARKLEPIISVSARICGDDPVSSVKIRPSFRRALSRRSTRPRSLHL